ncbi:MAG: type III-A CRISPR-associated RAMP protein Csm5 [Desulfobulbaceae bacterium]|jgi:CRISPR-associated protein Csm5|nr:type III-A CRISPR-associated RAMP protein Csm5 [Deltaproteobacteria bacterium]MDY0352280.1 type III-A CRISPR-associated RAMP protein Csm5 [Desulfobulbaceae bacterium]
MSDQIIHFRLTTISPLHIGCDEVFEPTSFVIDEKAEELISFETTSFLEQLDSDALQQFSAICQKGTIVSLLELLKFMRSQADLVDGQRIKVTTSFVEHYENTLGLSQNERIVRQELNNFKINRTAFDPLTENAYIPGSAIKGAIRTAVLNLRNNGRREPTFQGRSAGRESQEHILGFNFHHLESDPFRLLKVSDFFPVNDAARAISYAVDRKKRPSERESQAPYQILETVEPGAVFVGTISLLSLPGHDAGIRNSLTMDEIVEAVRTFYGAEKLREDKELEKIGVAPAGSLADGHALPLRIGRHSGAECVTISGRRRIKIMQGRNNPSKYLDHATTVWLAADSKKPNTTQGMQPFGWIGMKPLSNDEGLSLKGQAEEQKFAALMAMRGKVDARKQREAEIRQRAEAERREAEENAAHLAAEAAEREASLERERQAMAAMSEAEKLAHVVTKEDTTENEIVEIYNKLVSFEPEDQKIIAAALKKCWLSAGKWSKKQCSKKQWEKVQKVKTILGEA